MKQNIKYKALRNRRPQHRINLCYKMFSARVIEVSKNLTMPRLDNKTRGLRRWPTRETIVLRCKKLNPGSTEIFEFKVRNSELFRTSVPISQECVHENFERDFL